MIKVGIIGHFGGNNYFADGQTVKTKEINCYIEQKLDISTEKMDTYKIYRKPIGQIIKIKKMLRNNEFIIILLSSRGYRILLPIINFINKKYNKKILEFVIGGNRYNFLKYNKFYCEQAKKIEKIYVETEKMKNEYNKIGFNNVEIVPNFKNIEIKERKNKLNRNVFKLCTFSRVSSKKGILEAVEIVNECNKKIKSDIFKLDIYGQIDKEFKEEFEIIKKSFGENIRYRGIVDYNKSTDIISKYDLLLFLTTWDGEGFPGTILDALASGVPTIATDWKFNFDILKDNFTGLKVDLKEKSNIVNKILYLYNHQEEIIKMSENCIQEAKKYIPDNAMNNVMKYICGDMRNGK